MASSSQQSARKKLLRTLQLIYYILHRSFSKKQLLMDLHLFVKRGKIAGKAFANLFAIHHRYHTNYVFYNPHEVQFSFSKTPSFNTIKRKSRHNREESGKYEDAAVSKAFVFIDTEIFQPVATSYQPSPITIVEVDSEVDIKAEEFIVRFYEQLRLQAEIAATHENSCLHREPLVSVA